MGLLRVGAFFVHKKNLVRKCTTKAILILLISAFLTKNQNFLAKISTFTQRNCVRAVLEIC